MCAEIILKTSFNVLAEVVAFSVEIMRFLDNFLILNVITKIEFESKIIMGS